MAFLVHVLEGISGMNMRFHASDRNPLPFIATGRATDSVNVFITAYWRYLGKKAEQILFKPVPVTGLNTVCRINTGL